MKTIKIFTAICLLFISFGAVSQNSDDTRIMKDAEKAKEQLLKTDDALKNFFNNSEGYVIFPNVGKGGFIIGAASGNGVVYEDGIAIGMADLKKLNIGLQAGGQAIIEVIFFETEKALEEFKNGNFEFSAEVSAVALKSGVAANAKFNDGVAVFALPKAGLMAEGSVGGQKFTYHSF
ncbi:MAG: lipid-binding SYLF domain-containing protein [Flavobacteriaceae bacterium]|nr:lipid-binding SYLF domain-containing protein [Flavobacteriaceae bacterium]